ncbi:T9SS type A sorting domain-containing protein [Aquimarina sp. ERC-38]|uniref:T9SS type A sorting domain-containing protein n=1 Tax=Aquimarina sp. ERC-38 TaxID=2949996 RepID=UPI0022457B86|nr:T9SS type A sorting domain-containing protein [Aquimarina sp. ERC-38]UZO80494.1 T9SS type A sorting domain-containing protein [Aquimarina sp. ERC-38]
MKTNLLKESKKVWQAAVFSLLCGISFANAQDVLFTNVDPVEDVLTISNPTNATVDLSNYQLCLGPGTYLRIGSLTPIEGDVMLAAGEDVVLSYTMEDEADGLSLFSQSSFSSSDPTILIDYVQWGAANQPRVDQAVAARRWGDVNDFVMGVPPYTSTEGGSSEAWATALSGGTITGGPFDFIVDGTADMIPEGSITLEGAIGDNMSYVITDADLNILGLPPTIEALEGVNFDEAGVGVCLIWHISHDGTLTGAAMGENVSNLSGNFALSNSITVVRSTTDEVVGGTLVGGPYEFVVGDGVPSMIPAGSLTLEGAVGDFSGYIITDDRAEILGLPPTIEALEGVNFDDAGTGTCLIFHISHDGSLNNAEMGVRLGDLEGNFSISEPVRVFRKTVNGGTITGGPFEFTVDGTADMIPAGSITLDGAVGPNMSYVITDADLNILGLPPTIEALEGVNFDEAGAGVCLIWHISHDGSLEGAAVGGDASTLMGNFDLSNSITVIRPSTVTVDGGTLTGGPFEFVVGDGIRDEIDIRDITLEGAEGDFQDYLLTDEDGNILRGPTSIREVLVGVNFDTRDAGVCLIWHISHDGSLYGADRGANAADLQGNFDLSNAIEVIRTASEEEVEGGTLTGGPFAFCVGDGEADSIDPDAITLEGAVGANMAWVITDTQGEILGLPATFSDVDFDGAGEGDCLVWHISHDGTLEGAEVGAVAPGDLSGNFSLSNPITVERLTGDDCEILSTDDFSRETAFSVYPQPASTLLNLEMNLTVTNDTRVVLYNMVGQEVKALDITNENVTSIDVSDLSSGLYILSLTNQNGSDSFNKQVIIN